MFNLGTLKEIMTAYDTYRACWVEKRGNDDGFDEWFSLQVKGKEELTTHTNQGGCNDESRGN